MAADITPEEGIQFLRWGEMTDAARLAWFRHIEDEWGADLQGGYATVVYASE